MQLILASASATRQALLGAAGVPVETEASNVDETKLKTAGFSQGKSASAVALDLASAKALTVSNRHAGALVIGADQMLDCAGKWFDKPNDMATAADHLRRLSGRAHTLKTCAACALDGKILWSHVTSSTLTMRPLSDEFIATYLESEGQTALQSVGAYRIEGPGIQLFEKIDGDFFSILGLPLLALLAFLRQVEVLPT